MTVSEAKKMLRRFYNLTNPTEEDCFLYTEALEYLIRETKDSDYMVELGGMYYEQCRFDLALKYYELAAEYDNRYANTCLGYIWYYGRTGAKDYKKAFYYYDKARKMGDLIAAYKVADMYKNGYFVKKDMSKYKSAIEELYPKVEHTCHLNQPLPEIFTRLAKIRSEEGKVQEALHLYDVARDFLAQRIMSHPFFGDLNIMKWMIADIYKLRAFSPETMNLYDLYHVLDGPAKVEFMFEDSLHTVESVPEGKGLSIHFDDRWYRTLDDFFNQAEIDGRLITGIYEDLHSFALISQT